MQLDKDALLCDLAETYNIYDFDMFKPSKIAVFAMGLREDSRIKMKMAGMRDLSRLGVITHTADVLTSIQYYLMAKKDTAKPKLFYDILYEKDTEKDAVAFSSGEAFQNTWNYLSRGE